MVLASNGKRAVPDGAQLFKAGCSKYARSHWGQHPGTWTLLFLQRMVVSLLAGLSARKSDFDARSHDGAAVKAEIWLLPASLAPRQ